MTQEYGLLQVSNARHRANLQLGSLDVVAPTAIASLASSALTEIDVSTGVIKF